MYASASNYCDLLKQASNDHTHGLLSVLSKVDKNAEDGSIDTLEYLRIYEREDKKLSKGKTFEMERDWQELRHEKFLNDTINYESMLHRPSLKRKRKKFIENPFYFSNLSNSYENNGFGDHHLYGIYAGWPQVLMVDKEGYFTNQNDFLAKSVEKNISHRYSLLSSASTTQIVGRICGRDILRSPVLSMLRPPDQLVYKNLLSRQRPYQTKTKDHNEEALQPYAANINFPKRYPIEIDPKKPFPGSLKKLEEKQRRRRMSITPKRNNLSIIPKVRRGEPEKIFPLPTKTEKTPYLENKETQTTKDLQYQDIGEQICKQNRLEIDKEKEFKIHFFDNKRIPLMNYQNINIYQQPYLKPTLKTFYDLQPKVESPWLTKMIKTGQFTRQYYLENFRKVQKIGIIPSKGTIHNFGKP